MLKFLILGLITVCGCLAQRDQCPAQWQSFAHCLREQNQAEFQKAGLGAPSDSERRDLEDRVKTCFQKNDCENPIVSEDENRARLDCYRESQKQLRAELQDCVRKEVRDFSLPEDNFGNGDTWSLLLRQLNNAVKNYQSYCTRRTNQRDLRACVEQALSDFVKQRGGGGGPDSSSNSGSGSSNNWRSGSGSSSNSNSNNRRPQSLFAPARSKSYCEMRAQCMSNNGNEGNNLLTESCDREWRERAVPELCKCGQELRNQGRVSKYQGDYMSCMERKGLRTNANNDPAMQWLDKGSDMWCTRNNRGGGTAPCSGSGGGGSQFTQPPRGRQTTTDFFFNRYSSTSSPDWNGNGNGPDGSFTDQPWATQRPQNGRGGGLGGLFGGNGFGGFGGNGGNGGFGGFGGNGNGNSGGGFGGQGGNGNGNSGGFGGLGGNGNSGGLGGLGGSGLGNGGGLFGGGLGNLFGGGGGLGQSGGSGGDLFGGLLNNLGVGNPFDNGSLLSSLAGFAQGFQSLLGGLGGKR